MKESNLENLKEYETWLNKKLDDNLCRHVDKVRWFYQKQLKDVRLWMKTDKEWEEKDRFIKATETGIIDGWEDDDITIGGGVAMGGLEAKVREKFHGKSLTIKNCPNLEVLDLHGLKLTGLKIEKCPNLKTLDFSHNEVKEFDVSDLPSLETLRCSNNRLSELNLKSNEKLRNLLCDNNRNIHELELKHLKDLETLYLFNCQINKLDCGGLSKLKELYCANNFRKVGVLVH